MRVSRGSVVAGSRGPCPVEVDAGDEVLQCVVGRAVPRALSAPALQVRRAADECSRGKRGGKSRRSSADLGTALIDMFRIAALDRKSVGGPPRGAGKSRAVDSTGSGFGAWVAWRVFGLASGAFLDVKSDAGGR
jgi:hypothetical protein